MAKSLPLGFLAGLLLLGAASVSCVRGEPGADRFAGHEQLVEETHAASLNPREADLRGTIARNSTRPSGVRGENLWCLAALGLNEKTDMANARLLKRAQLFIASKAAELPRTSPEAPGNLPWTFFSITDYVRILCLFHARSPHFPGRLKRDTEAEMKEALWLWVRGESRIADTGTEDRFPPLGTENHDLNRRPPGNLITAFLAEDPPYRERKLDDGHSVAEHAAAHTACFREWPRNRARNGLWIEIGSTTYQKYSWPALFNLHELSPDPIMRHRFGLLLDLAWIEEAQISVRGRRGGRLGRAEGEGNGFAAYKNLPYARAAQPAGSSRSRVIETSRCQPPAAAILPEKRAFPAAESFAIPNRVLGELISRRKDGERQRIAPGSALVNRAWRTPHYLLGSTLQNPTLEYAGISGQKRWCGMLFDDPSAATVASIGTSIGQTRGGRPQDSFWSVQHENVLILQRIATRKESGSHSTGRIGPRFDAAGFEILDEDGWIFASNGKAFAGVKFLDGGHKWDKSRIVASPARFNGPGDTGRILLQGGDIVSHGSFARFRESSRGNRLVATTDEVDYQFGERNRHLVMFLYNVTAGDPSSSRLSTGPPSISVPRPSIRVPASTVIPAAITSVSPSARPGGCSTSRAIHERKPPIKP